ncbi:MAG: toxin-antitoxin system HicB family antitoxin [Acidimicrobiia bacterium]
MPHHIQIRDVPAAVHRELARQAEASGLSLNRFMLGECERIARRGRNVEVLRRAALRAGPRLSAEQIVATIRADRDRGE